jgi:hypothetical protein
MTPTPPPEPPPLTEDLTPLLLGIQPCPFCGKPVGYYYSVGEHSRGFTVMHFTGGCSYKSPNCDTPEAAISEHNRVASLVDDLLRSRARIAELDKELAEVKAERDALKNFDPELDVNPRDASA